MPFPILTSLIALPLAGALLLFLLRDDEAHADAIRRVALVVSALVFAESLLLWFRFDGSVGDFQFVERHEWIPRFGIAYIVGVDGISLFLVVLTAFLTPLALLSAWVSVTRRVRAFCMFMLDRKSTRLNSSHRL